jgi:hypothetical protein
MKRLFYLLTSCVSALATLVSGTAEAKTTNPELRSEQNTGTIKVSPAAKRQIAEEVTRKIPATQEPIPIGKEPRIAPEVTKPGVLPENDSWSDRFRDKGDFGDASFKDNKKNLQPGATIETPEGDVLKELQNNQPNIQKQ